MRMRQLDLSVPHPTDTSDPDANALVGVAARWVAGWVWRRTAGRVWRPRRRTAGGGVSECGGRGVARRMEWVSECGGRGVARRMEWVSASFGGWGGGVVRRVGWRRRSAGGPPASWHRQAVGRPRRRFCAGSGPRWQFRAQQLARWQWRADPSARWQWRALNGPIRARIRHLAGNLARHCHLAGCRAQMRHLGEGPTHESATSWRAPARNRHLASCGTQNCHLADRRRTKLPPRGSPLRPAAPTRRPRNLAQDT